MFSKIICFCFVSYFQSKVKIENLSRVKDLNFEISENFLNICVRETLENKKFEENYDIIQTSIYLATKKQNKTQNV